MGVIRPQLESEKDRAYREARENIKHYGRQMLNEILIRSLTIAYEEHQKPGAPTYESKDEVRALFARAVAVEAGNERLGLAD